MIYEARVFDKDGKLKHDYTREEMSQKHWMEAIKCKECDRFYFPKFRSGPQGPTIPGNTTYDTEKMKDRRPELGYCSTRCRSKFKAKQKNKDKPPPEIVMGICAWELCKEAFQVSRNGHKFCSKRCGRYSSKNNALVHSRKLKAENEEKRKNDKSIVYGG